MTKSLWNMGYTLGKGKAAPVPSGQEGFTLVETIAVLLVLGIVTAVVLTKSLSMSETTEIAAVDQLKTVMRYAQIRSMSSDASTKGWGISYGGNAYTLFNNGSTSSPVNIPGGDGTTATLPTGTTFGASGVVCFTERGEPSLSVPCTVKAVGNLSLAVGSKTITVYKNTGYIP